MSNKTAMQQLKFEIEKIKQQAEDKKNNNADRPMSESVIEADACIQMADHLLNIIVKKSLPTEKQNIIDARATAPLLNDAGKEAYIKEAEQYFNNTFE